MPTSKPIVFVSHMHRDAEVASLLGEFLAEVFNDYFSIFDSSDGSIKPGSAWRDTIYESLKDASVVLVIFSPESIDRAWVNFEVGAAWMRGKETILIPCLIGDVQDVPDILSHLQCIRLDIVDGLRQLVDELREPAKQNPRLNARFLQEKAAEFEKLIVGRSPATSESGENDQDDSLDVYPLNQRQKTFISQFKKEIGRRGIGLHFKLANDSRPLIFKISKYELRINLSDDEIMELARLGFLRLYMEPDPIELEPMEKMLL